MKRPPHVHPAPRPSTRRLPLASTLLALLLGWGYLSTLLPGIGYSGDAIKFQYLGRVLGIPHAPGYPLYMVLNHLFVTAFPVGTLAYRANVLTTLFAIGACLVLFKLLELLGVGRFVAFVMALTFGFSQTYWSQAIVAEVYSLLVLLMAVVLFFLVRWHKERRDRDFYLATALYALSFGNHLLAITLLPAFVYLVVVTDRSVFFQPQKVLWVLAVITLGAAQYLYLFWRLADPQTPYIEGFNGENFFHFVTGGPFKPLMFAFTPAQVLEQRLPLFLSFTRTSMPVLGLGIVGATFVRHTLRPVRLALLLYFLSNALYAVNYNIPDIDGYFLPNDLVVAIFAGLALGRAARWGRGRRTWHLVPLLLLPVVFYVTNYRIVDLSDRVWLQRETEAALEAVGRDALIVAPDYPRGQALLYYLIGYGWREERNLHATNLGWVRSHLRSYLEEEAPLPTLGRGEPRAGLPLYVFPCEVERFKANGFTVTRPADHLPTLCRLETAALNVATTSPLGQEGLFWENATDLQGGGAAGPRWGLGPSTRLRFRLDNPQPLTLVARLGSPFEGQEVTVEANGEVLERVALAPGEPTDVTLNFEGRAGENHLTFAYATWNHREGAPLRDARPLAVRFERLTLEAAEGSRATLTR